jgi:hypothetical protein
MLCLRLPHAPTPAELEQLRRFTVLVATPHRATAADVEALAAGWRHWWRERLREELCEMVKRTPSTLIAGDRRLATLALAAAAADQPRGSSGSGVAQAADTSLRRIGGCASGCKTSIA